jgi:nicotinamide mononucleotide transporter
MVVISGYVYWLENVRGQAALNVYFFFAQLVGWRRWATGQEPDMRRTARRLSPKQSAVVLLAWLLTSTVVAVVLHRGGGAFAELDAFTTVGSLIGQALIVAGFAEAWLAYLAVDIVLIALSVKAELWFYLAMYCVYCVLAWQGWRGWTRDGDPEKRTVGPDPS